MAYEGGRGDDHTSFLGGAAEVLYAEDKSLGCHSHVVPEARRTRSPRDADTRVTVASVASRPLFVAQHAHNLVETAERYRHELATSHITATGQRYPNSINKRKYTDFNRSLYGPFLPLKRPPRMTATYTTHPTTQPRRIPRNPADLCPYPHIERVLQV